MKLLPEGIVAGLVTGLLLAASGGLIGAGVILLSAGSELDDAGKFDVFVNIILIILGVLGVGGFATYQLLRDSLRRDAKARLDRETQQFTTERAAYDGFLLQRLAFMHWQEADQLWAAYNYMDLEDPALWQGEAVTQKRICLYLKLVVDESDLALGLSAGAVEETEYIRLVRFAIKSTAASALASMRRPEDLGRSLELAEELREPAKHDPYIREAVGWILMRFGEKHPKDNNRLEMGLEIIKEVLEASEFDQSLRSSLRTKYKKCFPDHFSES